MYTLAATPKQFTPIVNGAGTEVLPTPVKVLIDRPDGGVRLTATCGVVTRQVCGMTVTLLDKTKLEYGVPSRVVRFNVSGAMSPPAGYVAVFTSSKVYSI